MDLRTDTVFLSSHIETGQKCTSKPTNIPTDIISPVSIAVHERELKSNEAVQVGVIVPRRFVQKEDVPVRGDEHEAGEAVETAEHDAQGAFRAKHKHTTSVNNTVVTIHVN